ncbi:MAG: hypothetical protein HYT36_03310 [Candidatus Staskawiczbacteria bacterium]|nr:hypothetical protein [Candidatus Staskawiczbacteria bacterium]
MTKNLEELIKDIEELKIRVKKIEDGFSVKSNGGIKPAKVKVEPIDFSLGIRAFAKRYIAERSGPKRFTLLIAYFSKGKLNQEIDITEIRKQWNKMKTLLGDFNRFYSNEAKNNGWVDSRKYGFYFLTKEWEQIL